MHQDVPNTSAQAFVPGRILLSNPKIARIPKIKQVLKAAGWAPHRKTPQLDDALAVEATHPWQEAKAAWIGAAFLPDQPCPQNIRPAPLGLAIDTRGPLNDAAQPSDLETILSTFDLDDAQTVIRAHALRQRLCALQLCTDPVQSTKAAHPDVPFVLILDPKDDGTGHDQTSDTLRAMILRAQRDHPNNNIVIYAPSALSEDAAQNQIKDLDITPAVQVLHGPANPWILFERATTVYTQSSPLGFDAIVAGHTPVVFGQPWYAGWGLTQDQNPIARRTRPLTPEMLIAGALVHYCQWFDPQTKSLCAVEDILSLAEARKRAALEDADGYVASNMLRWKRPHMQRYFGQTALRFSNDADAIKTQKTQGRVHMAWGATEQADIRVEDGFLRSRGLGAALVRPLSLICDGLGIYFDPTRPSDLEQLITQSAALPDHAETRVSHLLTRLNAAKLSKYNVGKGHPELPAGHKILVAGQVEDDASIKLGAGDIQTNHALLKAARDANPSAVIVFKPHPDVEAGLRRGKVPNADELADVIALEADPIALIDACDEVWTMTSLIGFEALLRDTPVTCTGAPFYAGWGLTTDLSPTPERRTARPTVLGLAHATLIDYPRYFDPDTGAAISVEQAITLLQQAPSGRSKMGLAALAKIRQFRARFLGLDG